MLENFEIELTESLTAELEDEQDFSSKLLKSKIKDAIRKVRLQRGYPAYYQESMIEDDMQKYFSVCSELALRNYNYAGNEGQINVNDNGVSGSYRSENEILARVCKFAR